MDARDTHDDWTVDEYIKADCACGHRRTSHGGVSGPCSKSVRGKDYSGLPDPIYLEPDNFMEWPRNWPPLNEIPDVDKPCPCHVFADPEPDDPGEAELS